MKLPTLKEARKNAGLTLEQVAQNIGVTKQCVGIWEKKNLASRDRLDALEILYGSPTNAVPSDTGSVVAPSEQAIEMCFEVGLQLKIGRIRARKTQAQVARELGVTQSMIAKYEQGLTSLTMGSFMKLTQHYNMNPSKVFRDAYRLIKKRGNHG